MSVRSLVLMMACFSLAACEAPAGQTQAEAPSDPPADAPADVGAVEATAAPSIEADLVRLLQCAERPDPTPFLIRLAQAGRIDLDRNTGFDGISCFDLAQPIMLPRVDDEGPLPVETVCAFDETYPETLAGTPYEGRLYQRGPGTSPGMLITAVVREPSGGSAYQWLEAADARISARTERWSVVSDDPALVAITCNRLE